MDIKSFREQLRFRRRKHFPTAEEYLLMNHPEGDYYGYYMADIEIGNKKDWIEGYQKDYVEGYDPPFRSGLPWDNDSFDPDNIIQVSGDYMMLIKKPEDLKGALIYSNFTIKYGTVRALVKLPVVEGLMSAFWLFDGLPEMDIFEHYGKRRAFNCTHHWGYDYGEKYGKKSTLHNERYNRRLDFQTQWYVFEIELSPYFVTYKINGVTVKRLTRHLSNREQHVILDITKDLDYDSYDETGKLFVKKIEIFRKS